jgi:hypothetical protein
MPVHVCGREEMQFRWLVVDICPPDVERWIHQGITAALESGFDANAANEISLFNRYRPNAVSRDPNADPVRSLHVASNADVNGVTARQPFKPVFVLSQLRILDRP